ncbi:MAG: hypothetical protein QM770_03490 [Tepidisphaeraceae bacterium]
MQIPEPESDAPQIDYVLDVYYWEVSPGNGGNGEGHFYRYSMLRHSALARSYLFDDVFVVDPPASKLSSNLVDTGAGAVTITQPNGHIVWPRAEWFRGYVYRSSDGANVVISYGSIIQNGTIKLPGRSGGSLIALYGVQPDFNLPNDYVWPPAPVVNPADALTLSQHVAHLTNAVALLQQQMLERLPAGKE